MLTTTSFFIIKVMQRYRKQRTDAMRAARVLPTDGSGGDGGPVMDPADPTGRAQLVPATAVLVGGHRDNYAKVHVSAAHTPAATAAAVAATSGLNGGMPSVPYAIPQAVQAVSTTDYYSNQSE